MMGRVLLMLACLSGLSSGASAASQSWFVSPQDMARIEKTGGVVVSRKDGLVSADFSEALRRVGIEDVLIETRTEDSGDILIRRGDKRLSIPEASQAWSAVRRNGQSSFFVVDDGIIPVEYAKRRLIDVPYRYQKIHFTGLAYANQRCTIRPATLKLPYFKRYGARRAGDQRLNPIPALIARYLVTHSGAGARDHCSG